MSALDPCPDDLLARAPDTPLAPAERALLVTHTARCSSCRTAAEVARAFRDEPIALAGDDLVVARLAGRVRRASVTPLSGRPAPVRRWRVAAMLAISIGGAAAASLWAARSTRNAEPEKRKVAVVSPAAAPAPVERPGASPGPAVAAPSPSRVAQAPVSRSIRARPAGNESAEALLREARAARASTERSRAIELYCRLTRRFAGTPAAAVAEIALGTLYLEGGAGRDSDAALAAFDRYLASKPEGSLRQEALVGRARALEDLGRSTEALAAWRGLLAMFPGSPHAPLARNRIAALAPGVVAPASAP